MISNGLDKFIPCRSNVFGTDGCDTGGRSATGTDFAGRIMYMYNVPVLDLFFRFCCECLFLLGLPESYLRIVCVLFRLGLHRCKMTSSKYC